MRTNEDFEDCMYVEVNKISIIWNNDHPKNKLN